MPTFLPHLTSQWPLCSWLWLSSLGFIHLEALSCLWSPWLVTSFMSPTSLSSKPGHLLMCASRRLQIHGSILTVSLELQTHTPNCLCDTSTSKSKASQPHCEDTIEVHVSTYSPIQTYCFSIISCFIKRSHYLFSWSTQNPGWHPSQPNFNSPAEIRCVPSSPSRQPSTQHSDLNYCTESLAGPCQRLSASSNYVSFQQLKWLLKTKFRPSTFLL